MSFKTRTEYGSYAIMVVIIFRSVNCIYYVNLCHPRKEESYHFVTRDASSYLVPTPLFQGEKKKIFFCFSNTGVDNCHASLVRVIKCTKCTIV